MKEKANFQHCRVLGDDGLGIGYERLTHEKGRYNTGWPFFEKGLLQGEYHPSVYQMYMNILLYKGLTKKAKRNHLALLHSEFICRDSADEEKAGQAFPAQDCLPSFFLEFDMEQCQPLRAIEAFPRYYPYEYQNVSPSFNRLFKFPNGVFIYKEEPYYFTLRWAREFLNESISVLRIGRLFDESNPDGIPDCELYSYHNREEIAFQSFLDLSRKAARQNPAVDLWLTAVSTRNYLDRMREKTTPRCHRTGDEWMRLASCIEDKNTAFIAKWNKPIHIALKSSSRSTESHKDKQNDENFHQARDALQEAVAQYLPVIEQATGLDISLLSLGQERTANFVIYFDEANFFPPVNLFKTLPVDHHMRGDAFEFEQHMTAAVKFTPYSRSQVDGYFIPDEQGEIQRAACHIHPKLPIDLLQALGLECLLRGLGLPNASPAHPESVLGNWNSTFEPVSGVGVFDRTLYEMNEEYPRSSMLRPTARWPEMDVRASKAEGLTISNYELNALQALYSPVIAPGMEKTAYAKTQTEINRIFGQNQ